MYAQDGVLRKYSADLSVAYGSRRVDVRSVGLRGVVQFVLSTGCISPFGRCIDYSYAAINFAVQCEFDLL